jgi:hypothetical protein
MGNTRYRLGLLGGAIATLLIMGSMGPRPPYPSGGLQTSAQSLAASPRRVESQDAEDGKLLVYHYQFPSLGSPRLDEQLALYAQYLSQMGPPDVLIVGSSRSLQGIDPRVLEQALQTQSWGDLRVYNFSVNGATAQVIDVIVRQVLTPDQLPRLIIWGDGSRAFNSGRPDATYERLTASLGYAQLNQGDRPIQLTRVPEPRSQPFRQLAADEIPHACAPSIPPGEPGMINGMADPVQDMALSGEPDQPESLGDPCPPAIATDLTPQGFLAIADRFDPAVYYQQFPRVAGQYDGSYVPFELQGKQTLASVNLVNHLRRLGIPLVFVSLPLSEDYLDPVRQRYEQQFSLHMRQLAIAQGFTLVDLNRPDFQRNDLFADPSHINQFGAAQVADAIAQDPMVPWEVFAADPDFLPTQR